MIAAAPLIIALVALATSPLAAQAAPGEVGVPMSTASGSYTPTTDVTAQAGISLLVGNIKSQISDAEWNAVANLYVGSQLQTYATTDLPGPEFSTFKSHFGAGWMNTLIMNAINNVGNLANPAAKAEILEKTMMDAIAVTAIISDLWLGKGGNTGTVDQAKWDSAAALFIGADSSATPYGRANKRGLNYGTVEGTGEATANKKIIDALNGGPSNGNYQTVVQQLKVIYGQASIRYAWLLDVDMAQGLAIDDHQSEGWAFYRIIEPWVNAGDRLCSARIASFFSIAGSTPNTPPTCNCLYCRTLETVRSTLDLSSADLGTLEDVTVDCGARDAALSCDAAADLPGETSSAGKAMIASVALAASAAAAALF